MSDVFQRFSDFADSQTTPRWPDVGRYREGEHVCVATFINGQQRGEVSLIRGQPSSETLSRTVDAMEREFRKRLFDSGEAA